MSSRKVSFEAIENANSNSSSAFPKGGSKDSKDSIFLKLQDNKEARIRLIGDVVSVYRYYIKSPDGKIKSAITDEPENCVIKRKYNVNPQERYAVNIIDRADGKLKVLEAPGSVFREISKWANANKTHPGKAEGVDFMVTKNVKDPRDFKTVRYSVVPLKQTPITDAEKAMIKQSGLHDLEKVLKSTPQDQIEEVLYGNNNSVKTETETEEDSSLFGGPVGTSSSTNSSANKDFGF